MPARRNAVLTETEHKTPESPTVKGKRKRGPATSAQEEAEIQSSPRGRKRAKAEEQQSGTNGTHKQKGRKTGPTVDIEVEEDLTATITEQPNATLEVEEESELTIGAIETSKKRSRKPKAKSKSTEDAAVDEDEDEGTSAKPKRKRKTKEEKDAEAMPLAARTLGLNMYVGAHTSIAKGVENAITNCMHIGGNAFAMFLKSQRKWENPELKDENRDAFRKALIEHKYDGMQHVVPHGSYLVNLATEDKGKLKQSYDAFVDDLHRCEALGIRYYNFHPGGAGQSPLGEAITRLANSLNRALSETKSVVPLLENMAGHGTLIGGRFSDLRDVIAQIKPEYKSRIGVCIDTCHAFAAGYDLRSPEAFKKTMDEFDQTVGMKYLKALHLNDSKMPLDSHRDLHQNIGLGFLGLRAFHNVMNEPRFQGLPLILETPSERPDPDDPKGKKMIEDKNIWATEIKLLESLIDMDPEGDEFKQLESDLSERGREEREKLQAQHERITKEKAEKERKRLEKEKKASPKEREKGQKSLTDLFAPKGSANGAKKGKKQRKPGREESPGIELSEQSDSPLSDLSDLDEEEHRH